MNSLLLSILASLCADYFWQSEKIAADKDNLKLTAILWHGVTVFGSLLFFLHGYQWLTLIGYAALLTGVHLSIDLLKGLLNRVKNRSLNLMVFIMEQVLHVLAIVIIWTWFDLRANQAVVSFYENLVAAKTLPSFTGNTNGAFKLVPERFLLGAILYIYICFGGAILIEKFMLWLRQKEEVFEAGRTGKWIGILERVIVLSLILNNALGSVAFILTAKSIARFPELGDKDFAEYYLIGTLASTMLAICGGFLLNYLLTVG